MDLQATREPAAVRAEIAHAVGLFDGPAGPAADRLDAWVADRALLVVIDNFEQVVAAASVVADMLSASPRSKAIVTSRTALKVRAEQEYPVRPLGIDGAPGDGDSEAVRLFVDRARRVRPEIDLAPGDVEAIRETCRLVDGLPLAIELCAARAGSLPLGLIRDRLAAHRPLPGSGPRDLPERQRTIEATVAWSHDLLERSLQQLFARLGVFEESLDHAQAELVGGPGDDLGTDVLDGLVRLTEQNLLSRVEDAVGGVRFGWLETIRSHALERLAASGERAVIEARHVQAFASLSSEAAAFLPGGRQAWWLDRLAADDANIRAATRRAIASGDVEPALTLAGSLWRYWLQTGRLSEGQDLVTRALALPCADAPTVLRVRALDAAGGLAYWSGDVPKANAIYEAELDLAREIGDRPGEAIALLDLFFTREFAGDISAALAARAESAEIMRELGDDLGLARVTHSTFLVMFALGRQDPTVHVPEMFEKADWYMALEDPWLARTGPALHGLARWAQGDVRGAMRWLARGLRENLAVRERTETAVGMQFFVVAAPMVGYAEMGAVIHGACQAAQEALGIRAPASYAEMAGMDPIPLLRAELGEVRFADAVERGRRLSLEEAFDLIEEVSASLSKTT